LEKRVAAIEADGEKKKWSIPRSCGVAGLVCRMEKRRDLYGDYPEASKEVRKTSKKISTKQREAYKKNSVPFR